MSKITNADLTRSGTGCFIVVPMATVHGRQGVNFYGAPAIIHKCNARY